VRPTWDHRKLLERIGLDQILSIADGGPARARADGLGEIYSPGPYNYLRVTDVDGGMPAMMAAGSGKIGSGGTCGADLMI
jgi:hypothetical protein